jgi:hypothetical protein
VKWNSKAYERECESDFNQNYCECNEDKDKDEDKRVWKIMSLSQCRQHLLD